MIAYAKMRNRGWGNKSIRIADFIYETEPKLELGHAKSPRPAMDHKDVDRWTDGWADNAQKLTDPKGIDRQIADQRNHQPMCRARLKGGPQVA